MAMHDDPKLDALTIGHRAKESRLPGSPEADALVLRDRALRQCPKDGAEAIQATERERAAIRQAVANLAPGAPAPSAPIVIDLAALSAAKTRGGLH